jgi:hypothetical protein
MKNDEKGKPLSKSGGFEKDPDRPGAFALVVQTIPES